MKKTSNRTLRFHGLLLVNLVHLCVLIVVAGEKDVVAGGKEAVSPYTPIEDITINCGSFAHSIASDGRLWSAENNSKFPVIHSQNKQSLFLSSSTGHEPYVTSRHSFSEFTYMIPLTAGQKFIRLHFRPRSYPGFDLSKAYFTVTAGWFTLLRNFSALLHAQGKQTLVKEFCANVEDGETLNITFTPSSISEAYAFVNGIEVVSMPTNLYYRPADDEGIPLVGQHYMYSLGNQTAGEMMHRISTGGASIPPAKDTGMYRAWSTDDDYLTIAKPSDHPFDTSVTLTFSNTIASFAAPRDVYVTARTMGVNKTMNQNDNLTWEFPVDSGFSYFVRLHFCEFQIEITERGDRMFEIFLANLTATTEADIIAWSGGNGIPVYRDYTVAIYNKGNQKKQNLSIQLHPSPAWRTRYSDAILNGVEIFKLSKSGGDLSGPNPDPTPSGPNPEPTPIVQSRKKKAIIVTIVTPLSGFVTISLLLFFIFHIRSNKFSTNSNNIPAAPSDICRPFSLREIKTATNNFDTNFIIGRGGFGDVYKGFVNAGSTQVAIKRLNPGSKQGVVEFRTEIDMLSKLRHQNLVSLIGYCEDNKEMILVYDYMVHGTLRDHLYNTGNPPLPWEQRLKMCIGAAHGLHYLHRGPNDHTIIHRDVKTTNILVSEKWVAKVSDFGLSKMNDVSNTHISTAVKGSFGYLDPEYYRLHKLTEKSDVYSFGVVLCEVLCARAPIERNAEDPMKISLAEWAQHCYSNESLDQIIDPCLQGKIRLPSLLKFGEVAISCLASEGTNRPTMSEVVCGLEVALKMQGISEVNGNDENQANDSSAIDYHVLYTSGSGSMNVGR